MQALVPALRAAGACNFVASVHATCHLVCHFSKALLLSRLVPALSFRVDRNTTLARPRCLNRRLKLYFLDDARLRTGCQGAHPAPLACQENSMDNPPAWQHVQIIGGVYAVLQPNTRRVIRITYQEKWCAA
jgi:hypothetical protein